MSNIKVTVKLDIDLPLFKKQKEILYNVITAWGEADDPEQRIEAAELEGIMNILDHIHDACEPINDDSDA